MISIVIPLYNKAEHIANTLQSVISQSYQDFEIIIVDDGSTDGSINVVKAISDKRIRVYQKENGGVSSARNYGIQKSNGEFIAFLDADDEWKSEYLKTQHELTERWPECAIFATNYNHRKNTGEENPIKINKIHFKDINGTLDNYFIVAANSNPPLWTSAIMVRKEALLSVGGFPLGIKSGEDLLTWARLACKYKIAYSKKPLAVFNLEGYNIKESPKRVPAEVDYVGQELKKLQNDYHCPGLKTYRGLWHKMRASVYMRLKMRKKAYKETIKSLLLNPFSYKTWAYLIVNSLP